MATRRRRKLARKEVLKLSVRHRKVLNLLLYGHTPHEIAGTLELDAETLADDVRRIYKHFHVHSQHELVRHFLPISLIHSAHRRTPERS